MRKPIDKICLNCNKNYESREYRSKFCSQSCSAIFNNTGKPSHNNRTYIKVYNKCLNCNSNLISSQRKFCSRSCFGIYRYRKRVEDWKSGNFSGNKIDGASKSIKKYIWEKYNNQCARCGWKEKHNLDSKPPLEVEHIDGNYKNNSEDNLILLCPNCHALTDTYRGRNIGHGREKRYK